MEETYLDLPDSEDTTALRDILEDFAAGVIAAAAPVVLRDDIQTIRIEHGRHIRPQSRTRILLIEYFFIAPDR